MKTLKQKYTYPELNAYKRGYAKGYRSGKLRWVKICTEMNHELEYPVEGLSTKKHLTGHKIGGLCLSLSCAEAQEHVKPCPLYGQPYIK